MKVDLNWNVEPVWEYFTYKAGWGKLSHIIYVYRFAD